MIINLLYVTPARTLSKHERRRPAYASSTRPCATASRRPGFSMTALRESCGWRGSWTALASTSSRPAFRSRPTATSRPSGLSPPKFDGRSIAGLARACTGDVERAAAAVAPGRPPPHSRLPGHLRPSPSRQAPHRSRALPRAGGGSGRAWRGTFVDDVEFSAEDATRSDLAFLCEVAEAVVDAGATTVNLPDTVGYALPDDIRTCSTAVGRQRRRRARCCRRTATTTSGMAVANSLAAVQAGARQVECTINGIGERAGNAALEEIVMALHVRRDRLAFHTGIRTIELYATSRMLSDIVVGPGAAQQGHRRRQRVRARSRHPSGRRAEEPADLRDPASRKASAPRARASSSASTPARAASMRGAARSATASGPRRWRASTRAWSRWPIR